MNRNFLCVALLAFALAACSAESTDTAANSKYAGYTPYTIQVADLLADSATGRTVIDLGIADYGYWVDSGVDFAAVDMICPSGRVMTLDGWVDEVGAPNSIRDSGVFLYSSGALDAATGLPQADSKKIPPCDENVCTLEQETDGTWVCLCPPQP